MSRYRIRFNLKKDENYRKWRINDTLNNTVKYYTPDTTFMYLYDCVLHNEPHISRTIFNGGNELVCGWIDCDNIDIRNKDNKCDVIDYIVGESGYEITYNPHVYYHWVDTRKDVDFVIDNKEIPVIYINNRTLIVPEKFV
tara:strand:+ start:230 stop:649 length:420 start_codon:yes stop_codon:yes gene_type:complete